MAPASGQPSHALTLISRYAASTGRGTRAVIHAQQVGVQPGQITPWKLDYQRAAVGIWLETCPESYVAQIGEAMSTYAAMMRTHDFIDGPVRDWAILLEQAEGIVTAVDEQLCEVKAPRKGLHRTGSVPALIRYDKLAALADQRGLIRLEAASANVETYCQRRSHGDLTTEEIEWLRALAAGKRTAEVADRAGHSERDFYRVLSRLWERLGVDGRGEAIGLASEMGWLKRDD